MDSDLRGVAAVSAGDEGAIVNVTSDSSSCTARYFSVM